MIGRSEKLGKKKLNEFMTTFFGKPTSLDWTLMWWHQCGQEAPRWRDFLNGERFIAAVAPIQLKRRTFWLMYRPPERVEWGQFFLGGVAHTLAAGSFKLYVWLVDPRTLRDGPSAYTPDTPKARRYRVSDLDALRRVVDA